MTLIHKTPRVRYTGDGTTKTFTVPFFYGEQSHLSVVLYHKDKSQSQAKIASSTGANHANGGTVTLTSAPSAGVIVTVLRQVDYAQKLRLDVGGELPSKSLEYALDYTVMQTQQLSEIQGRSLRLMPHTGLSKPILVEEPKDGTAPVYKQQKDGSYRLVPSSGSLESQLAESKGYLTTVTKLSKQVQADKRLVDGYKTATETTWTKAQKLLQDTQTKLASFDTSSFANSTLSNVTNTDFKTKAKSAGLGEQALPTQIFTQTSGKFFVRNANGTLPSGITAGKVWSLAEQKTAGGGGVPSGKTHIELPNGIVKIKLAGGGGGGGGEYYGRDGSYGGNTTLDGNIATGGTSGHGDFHGSTRGGRTPQSCTISSNAVSGYIKYGLGGKGGDNGFTNQNSYNGGNGQYGNLIEIVYRLSHGAVKSYSIGAGGSGGSGSNGAGATGGNGWIEVEYA